MKKIIFLLILLCAIGLNAIAQSSKFVHIGDRIPDMKFKISHYSYPYAHISDFKGKYIILDLWGKTCGGCIATIPKMQGLQKKYRDQLQVIMVTKDPESEVKKLAAHSVNVRDNDLPSVMGDTAFSGLFNYKYLPTYVWVDPNGIVKYITNTYDMTEENLLLFLEGKELLVKEIVDVKTDFDLPDIIQWYPYNKKIGIYSYLAPMPGNNIRGMGNWSRLTNDSGNIYRIDLSSDLSQLYFMAYLLDNEQVNFRSDNISKDRLIIKLRDSSLFISDEATAKNIFIYNLITNNNAPTESVYRYMQKDLDFFLKAHSSLIKKEISCLVIKRLPDIEQKLFTKHPDTKPEESEDYQTGKFNSINIHWEGAKGSLLSSGIKYTGKQIIDETGISFDKNVDFGFIKTHWKNLSSFNKELESYGLQVSEEKRLLYCILIEDSFQKNVSTYVN